MFGLRITTSGAASTPWRGPSTAWPGPSRLRRGLRALARGLGGGALLRPGLGGSGALGRRHRVGRLVGPGHRRRRTLARHPGAAAADRAGLDGGRVDEQRDELAGAGGAGPLDGVEVRLAAQHELGVALFAHERGELGAVAAVDRLGADVRLGVGRAVPVEVVATGAPAATVVLGDGHLEVRGVVGALDGAVRPADRQLPADVGLGLVRRAAGEHRVLVQGAPGAGGEAGPVEEDAGAVDHLGLAGVVLLLGPRLEARRVLVAEPAAAGVHLPLVLTELGHHGLHALEVVVVGEVRTEGAAAVVGAVGVDALAARPEDARPARRQPGEVEPEALAGVGGVGHLGPGAGDVEGCLGHAPHPRGGPGQPLRWAHAPRGHRRRIEHGPPARRRRAPRRPAAARLEAQDRPAAVRARHRRRPDRRRGARPARRLRAGVRRGGRGPGRRGPQRLRHQRHPRGPERRRRARHGRRAHRCRRSTC